MLCHDLSLVEEGDLPLHPCISGCPGLGGQRVAPSARQMGVLPWQVGNRARGQRCPGEPERAGAHSQVLGVQLCAVNQATRGFGEVQGRSRIPLTIEKLAECFSPLRSASGICCRFGDSNGD